VKASCIQEMRWIDTLNLHGCNVIFEMKPGRGSNNMIAETCEGGDVACKKYCKDGKCIGCLHDYCIVSCD